MLKKIERCIPFIIIIASILLITYPYISNALFEHRIESEIEQYDTNVSSLNGPAYKKMTEEAQTYNDNLATSQIKLTDPFVHTISQSNSAYENILSIDNAGIMGYIDIPIIDVYLPIYHGTSAKILERGVGHLEGTSLPIGGNGSHAVLTGHTGLNNAKLFTDLTEVHTNDLFFIHILEKTLAYQVYSVEVVLPEQTSSLRIEAGSDLVTLITCTPYGVNTHRLMVHGKRTDYTPEQLDDAVNAAGNTSSQWMTSYKRAITIGLVTVAALYLGNLIFGKMKNRNNNS